MFARVRDTTGKVPWFRCSQRRSFEPLLTEFETQRNRTEVRDRLVSCSSKKRLRSMDMLNTPRNPGNGAVRLEMSVVVSGKALEPRQFLECQEIR
jgi:hypothetical protein